MFAMLLLMVLPQAKAAELQLVEADPADVVSIDAVVQAYYQSLSGEPGDRHQPTGRPREEGSFRATCRSRCRSRPRIR